MTRARTIREEANALTCHAFRNGKLEDLHAGKYSELLADPTLSRITDGEMKDLMIEASAKLAQALLWKETEPERYWKLIDKLCSTYTRDWVKDHPTPERVAPGLMILRSFGTSVARGLGRPVSDTEVEAALTSVMNRGSYDLDSEHDRQRLFDDLCAEVGKQTPR